MSQIGVVSLRGLLAEDFQYTFLLKASDSAIADAGIKAVSLDTTAANTVKLAAEGELILGRLEVFEDRVVEGVKTGMVALKGGIEFLVDPEATDSPTDETPAVGDHLVGAQTAAGLKGHVRKATTAEIEKGMRNWLVVEVRNSGATVVAINV